MWRTRLRLGGDVNYARYRDTAIELARRRGLSALTFDALARAAKTTKSSLQNYFPNRQELLRVPAAAWCDALETFVVSGTDRMSGLGRLWALASGFAATLGEHAIPLELLREARDGDQAWLAVQAPFRDVLSRWYDLLIAEASVAKEQGELRSEADPERLGGCVFYRLMSLGWRVHLGRKVHRQVRAVTGEVWDLLSEAAADPVALLPDRLEALDAVIEAYDDHVARRHPFASELTSEEAAAFAAARYSPID